MSDLLVAVDFYVLVNSNYLLVIEVIWISNLSMFAFLQSRSERERDRKREREFKNKTIMVF